MRDYSLVLCGNAVKKLFVLPEKYQETRKFTIFGILYVCIWILRHFLVGKDESYDPLP